MKKSIGLLVVLLGLEAWHAEAVAFDPARDVDVKVVYEGQMPKVSVDGVRHEPWLAISGMGLTDDGDCGKVDEAFRKLYDRGFRFFQVNVHQNRYYIDEGKYDFTRVGRRIERILSYAPEAYIVVLLRFTHADWCRKHPEDAIVYTRKPLRPKGWDGEHMGCPIRPSAASAAFRAEVGRTFAAFGEYVRAQPWSKRLVGVRPGWGTYTEWHTFGFVNGPDASPVMTKRFREYLAEKGRPDPSAQVPDGESRIREGRILLDPVKDARIIDFFNCNAETVADLLVEMCRDVKEALPGRLAGAYYGYVMTGHNPEGANVLLDRVLSSPSVDFLSDPSEYYTFNRVAGGCFLHRTLTSPFHRYRKMSFIEDDTRFHPLMADPAAVKTGYVVPTVEQSRAVIKRNFLNGLFDGSAYQYNDPSANDGTRTYWMDDPDVLAAFDVARSAYLKAGTVPAESGNDTVVVVSPRENLRMDGNPHTPEFLRKLYRCLDRFHSTGAGVDVMAFEDYLVAKKDWTRVVFANLFSATSEEEKTLAARLRCVEKVAYFAAPEKSFCDRFFAGRPTIRVTEIPDTPEDARALLAALGTRFYTDAGTCFRHHAALSMLHTGKGGTWRLSLSDDPKATVEELFSGRTYPAKGFTVSADIPETWLFKLRK